MNEFNNADQNGASGVVNEPQAPVVDTSQGYPVSDTQLSVDEFNKGPVDLSRAPVWPVSDVTPPVVPPEDIAAVAERLKQQVARNNKLISAVGLDPMSDIGEQFENGMITAEQIRQHALGRITQYQQPQAQVPSQQQMDVNPVAVAQEEYNAAKARYDAEVTTGEITIDSIPEAIKKKLIEEGFNTGYGKGKGKSAADRDAILAEMGLTDDKLKTWKELEKKAEENKNKEMMDKGEFDKLLEKITKAHGEVLSAKDKQLLAQDTRLKDLIIDQKIRDVAEKNDARNPSELVVLLSKSVKLNENGEPEVFGSNGERLLNDKGGMIDIPGLVINYLNDNPHHVKGTGSGGTGVKPGGKTPSGKRIYTREDIKDQKFYQANRDDILLAQKENRIR